MLRHQTIAGLFTRCSMQSSARANLKPRSKRVTAGSTCLSVTHCWSPTRAESRGGDIWIHRPLASLYPSQTPLPHSTFPLFFPPPSFMRSRCMTVRKALLGAFRSAARRVHGTAYSAAWVLPLGLCPSALFFLFSFCKFCFYRVRFPSALTRHRLRRVRSEGSGGRHFSSSTVCCPNGEDALAEVSAA